MNVIKGKNTDLAHMCEKLYSHIKSRLPSEARQKNPYTFTPGDLVYKKEWRAQSIDIYTKAIQEALNKNLEVYIPYFADPLYVDGPIILNSGNSLVVHPETQIVLIHDRCILHNRNIVSGSFSPVMPGSSSDVNVSVSGGIWCAPGTERLNDQPYRDFHGCDSLFTLHNVINARMENLTIRDSKRMGLQIGNCEGFVVQGIKLENTVRDGIHVEGPAAYGLIRDIEGLVGDDHVALNAWDWDNSSLTYGSIHDVIVEDIKCEPGYLWSEMRLHPGNRILADGRIIECSLYNIIMHKIEGIHTLKMYHQPNLMTPGLDPSAGIGSMYNIFMDDVTFDYIPISGYYTSKQSAIELHANVENFYLKSIKFNYPLCDPEFSSYSALGVGPLSKTWPCGANHADISGWIEFFAPNYACNVQCVAMENITVLGKVSTDVEKLVEIRKQSVNADYPNTTPAGGTGFGNIGTLYISP